MPSLPDPPASPSTPPDDEWVELSLALPQPEAEHAAAILERFAPAGTATVLPFVQSDDFGLPTIRADAVAVVSCFFPVQDWAAMQPKIAAALQAADWTTEPPGMQVQRLRRQDWETAWHAFVEVVRCGRLVVCPRPRTHDPLPGDVVVQLEPGLAFGTGSHETTRMALAALEATLQPGQTVLDFGAGSGVLSCAAARLGATRVDAVDIDPQAIYATKRNAALNNVSSIVHVQEGNAPGAGIYDVVVANITAATVVRHVAALAAATKPGGVCILGGIIEAQVERVRRAVAETALEIREIDADGEWRTIRAARPANLS